jgi:hypothetical protein
MDSYDHLWGIFITAAGKRRRIDAMVIPPTMWPYALLGWSGSKQYLRFLRQHTGNVGMNLNSHGLFRMVEVRAKPLPGPAAAVAASGGGGGVAGTQQERQQEQHTAVEQAAAGRGTDGSSASLAEAVAYARTSSAAGMTKVVLTVPDESPPLDRDLKEWWPQGWAPTAATAPAAQPDSRDACGAAKPAAVTTAGAAAAGVAAVQSDGVVQVVQAQQRVALAVLVHAGRGSDRPVLGEADICQLLGVPYREPWERCC